MASLDEYETSKGERNRRVFAEKNIFGKHIVVIRYLYLYLSIYLYIYISKMNRCVCCKEHHTSHTHTRAYIILYIYKCNAQKKRDSNHFNMRMKPTASTAWAIYAAMVCNLAMGHHTEVSNSTFHHKKKQVKNYRFLIRIGQVGKIVTPKYVKKSSTKPYFPPKTIVFPPKTMVFPRF